MGTITNREIIDEIIAHNGSSPGDPPAVATIKIVEYENSGETVWGTVLHCEVGLGMADRYEVESVAIKNPRVIWTRSDYGQIMKDIPTYYYYELARYDSIKVQLTSGHAIVVRGDGMASVVEPEQRVPHTVWRLPSLPRYPNTGADSLTPVLDYLKDSHDSNTRLDSKRLALVLHTDGPRRLRGREGLYRRYAPNAYRGSISREDARARTTGSSARQPCAAATTGGVSARAVSCRTGHIERQGGSVSL